MQFLFQKNGLGDKLLRDSPDRYIYEAVRKGVDISLPEAIAAGINDVSKRENWNQPADKKFALPTETWREHIVRRTRCLELQQKLKSGEIDSIDDFITYNLDIRQFAQDVIENCYDPELIWAFYQAISEIKILDPTCGSGAFLFAALNILEPFYEACLERMEVFIKEDFVAINETYAEIFDRFRQILSQVDSHSNRRYFILKSIVLNNLYGVDIMQEATEICKLRLFLKLVAQLEPDVSQPNLNIEPLPDVDFNIKAGNTLVGFSSYKEVKKAVEVESIGQKKIDLFGSMERIDQRAEAVDRTFQEFKALQTINKIDAKAIASNKDKLNNNLSELRNELDHYLADEYEQGQSKKPAKFKKWKESHQPFHWFVEFYGIIKRGGFDVVIGNPPYIQYSKTKLAYCINNNNYQTFPSRNLYSFVFEKAKLLSKTGARLGIIVQISSVSTPTMETMVKEINTNVYANWISNFATRPACLFDGITMNLTIIVSKVLKDRSKIQPVIFSTHYLRWHQDYRRYLFQHLTFNKVDNSKLMFCYAIPKLQSSRENDILSKIISQKKIINDYLESPRLITKQKLSYRTAGGRYFKIFIDQDFGSESKSNKSKYFKDKYNVYVIIAVLSSNTWWWYYTLHFDMYNCKDYMMYNFPFDYNCCKYTYELEQIGRQLSNSMIENAEKKTQNYASTGERTQLIFKPSLSKLVINEIDKNLAQHYGFTDEELDFIINYDIKYRMGQSSD